MSPWGKAIVWGKIQKTSKSLLFILTRSYAPPLIPFKDFFTGGILDYNSVKYKLCIMCSNWHIAIYTLPILILYWWFDPMHSICLIRQERYSGNFCIHQLLEHFRFQQHHTNSFICIAPRNAPGKSRFWWRSCEWIEPKTSTQGLKSRYT